MSDNSVAHRRGRSVRRAVAGAATVLAAVGVPFAAPGDAFAATGDAQVLVVSNSSANLNHAVRSANGSWTVFGNVENAAGQLGSITDTAGVVISGALHTLAVGSDGDVHHAIRNANGTWAVFTNVESVAGQIGTVTGVAAANVGGLLHVVASTSTGGLFHTIRNADGSWTGFGDVKAATAADPGTVTDVSAAGFANGQLQVVVAIQGGGLFHTIRNANGSWQQFNEVKQAAGDPGSVTRVSSANVGGDLHVVVATSGGGLSHTIRFTNNGNWQPFGNVKVAASDPGPVTDVGATGLANGQLQVLVSTNDGGLWHAIRMTNGNWTIFGNVKNAASDPGPATSVSIAGQ